MDAHQWGKFKSWINSDAFPTSRLKLVVTSIRLHFRGGSLFHAFSL